MSSLGGSANARNGIPQQRDWYSNTVNLHGIKHLTQTQKQQLSAQGSQQVNSILTPSQQQVSAAIKQLYASSGSSKAHKLGAKESLIKQRKAPDQ